MSKGEEYTTLNKELNNLEEGQTLVSVVESREKQQGFYLHIGDKRALNTWEVTRAELLELQMILNNKFPL